MIKHFIFARLLLIEDYGKWTLQKELLIVPTQNGLKQLLWESLTDKFHSHLQEFAEPFHFWLPFGNRRLWTGCSAKEADLCGLTYFEKVLLMTFIRTYRNLLKSFIFAHFLLLEDYE